MVDIVALVALAATTAGVAAFHFWEARAWRTERAQWAAERSRLLDRVMARTYQEFVYSKTSDATDTPQLTTDQAEAAWFAAQAREGTTEVAN